MVISLSPTTQLVLNFLRAVSAQLVLFGHCRAFVFGLPKSPLIENIAVMIFFILSGFLISFSLIRKNFQITFKDFFLARFCRIYSGLLPCILFVGFIDFCAIKLNHYSHFQDFSMKTFLGNLFMLQGFPGCHISTFGSARPFWTLNIEWWLYCIFGWASLKFLFNKSSKNNFFFDLLVLVLLLLMPLRNKCDLTILWFLGVLISFLLAYKNLVKQKNIALLFSVVFLIYFILFIIRHKVDYNLKGYIILFFSFLFLLFYTENCTQGVPRVISKITQFFADYSFTLYLVHCSICELLSKYTNSLFFLIILSNFVALSLAEFTEKKHKILYNILKNVVTKNK